MGSCYLDIHNFKNPRAEQEDQFKHREIGVEHIQLEVTYTDKTFNPFDYHKDHLLDFNVEYKESDSDVKKREQLKGSKLIMGRDKMEDDLTLDFYEQKAPLANNDDDGYGKEDDGGYGN